jgi:hypothetical protein
VLEEQGFAQALVLVVEGEGDKGVFLRDLGASLTP